MKGQVVVDVGEFLIDTNEDTQLSSVIDMREAGRKAVTGLIIYGPGAADGTLTLQESYSDEDTDVYGSTWRDVQSGGVDITIPVDGVVRISLTGFHRLRISSGSAESVNRRLVVRGLEASS